MLLFLSNLLQNFSSLNVDHLDGWLLLTSSTQINVGKNCSFIDHNRLITKRKLQGSQRTKLPTKWTRNEEDIDLRSGANHQTSAFCSDISGKGITNSQRTLPHQHKIYNKTPPTEVSLHTATRTLRILHLSPTHQQLISSQQLNWSA